MSDAPAPGRTALLIIDMINEMDFETGEDLRRATEAIVDPILSLRAAADAAGAPVIYVNDNGGEWRSERSGLIERALSEECRSRGIVERVRPRDDDYFIIKPRFSAFYATNLPVVLPQLGVSRLVLTGVAADICVLFTAGDAHMREYDLWVPADAVAAEDPQRARWALEIMRGAMKADVRATTEQRLDDWIACAS